MSWSEILALSLAAAAGGAINAVAGGGTLLTFPTLLLFGVPPIVANATSTLALVVGTSGSIFGYRRNLPAVKHLLWRFIPISFAGGLIGSILLTRTTDRLFSRLVPFLILFATLLFLAQGAFRNFWKKSSAVATSSPGVWWGTLVFQFGVAVYGGYFGAGIGILMLASLGFIGLSDIHEMNTVKTVLGSLINLVAALWFLVKGLVDPHRAAIMTVGALIGYFLGAHYSQKIPQPYIRRLITAIGFTLAAATFYEQFFK